MKVFKEYFELNEQKWLEVLKGLKEYIDKLRRERELLLGKFKSMNQIDTKAILKQKELTMENLVQHKALIEKLIGE